MKRQVVLAVGSDNHLKQNKQTKTLEVKADLSQKHFFLLKSRIFEFGGFENHIKKILVWTETWRIIWREPSSSFLCLFVLCFHVGSVNAGFCDWAPAVVILSSELAEASHRSVHSTNNHQPQSLMRSFLLTVLTQQFYWTDLKQYWQWEKKKSTSSDCLSSTCFLYILC